MVTVLIVLASTVIHLSTGSLVNIALRKPVTMSSSRSGYNASTAVDGDTDTNGYGRNQIIHTHVHNLFAWWKVDLQREVQDATARIYFRTDCYVRRRNGVELYTSTSPFPDSNPTSQGQLCHTVTGDPSGSDIPDVYNVTCPGRWRYLLLYTDTDNDEQGAVLDFGEVEVFECPAGTFGSDCTSCSTRHCQGESDCPADGTCSRGCQDGYTGQTCKQTCPRDLYGPSCSMTCGNCSSDDACHHVTGNCPAGCKVGWRTQMCNEVCMVGYYGPDCTEKCGQCDGVCNRVDGRCPAGCLDGYNGTKCDVALSAIQDTEPVCSAFASVVGTFVGTLLVVVLVNVGIHLCLVRHGRMQWVKNLEDKKPVSHDVTQMSNTAQQPGDVSGNVQADRSHVFNNDYAVLDSGTKADNKDYDVIQQKHYQNI